MREQIIQNGEVAVCDYCHSEKNPTIELNELAEQVHSVLEEHFSMTSPDPEGIDLLAAREGNWEQPGELVTDVIVNLINSSDELAESVREFLSEQYDPAGKDALIDPGPYDGDSQYEERAIDTYDFQESWASFRREILLHARFFNQSAKSALEHLFSGIERLTTHDGKPVVRVLGPEASVFRARIAKPNYTLEKILKAAPLSLGAPTGRYASAGRMNAEGISIFYGATDVDTCIAEIRAPVGSTVVIGQFFPLRELRLLDLTELKNVFLQGSLFDSAYTESYSRVHFLKRLEAELSQPVTPGAESRDYIPTQVVAEYLGSHPDMKLDGVMFASSQITPLENTGTGSKEEQSGKNIVLFSHACGLESYDIPDGTEIKVSFNVGNPVDPDYSIWIWEKVPNSTEQEEKVNPKRSRLELWELLQPSEPVEEQLGARIRLDMESIQVRTIESVSYKTFSIDVSRHRSNSRNTDF